MINKVFASPQEAIADVYDGCSIMFGGFGTSGLPTNLIRALRDKGTRDITAIANSAGGTAAEIDISLLYEKKQIKKVVTSFPIKFDRANAFEPLYLAGEVELEIVPQGTLAERIRAGGVGVPAFYTPTGVGTEIEKDKEKRSFNGREYLLELAINADFAFVRAFKGDRLGNLVYRKGARNFNPIMAMAAKVTIAEVDEIVEVGELDPEVIVTPGIFVHRVVRGKRHEVGFK